MDYFTHVFYYIKHTQQSSNASIYEHEGTHTQNEPRIWMGLDSFSFVMLSTKVRLTPHVVRLVLVQVVGEVKSLPQVISLALTICHPSRYVIEYVVEVARETLRKWCSTCESMRLNVAGGFLDPVA